MTWLITIVAGLIGVPRPVASVIAWAVIAMAVFGTIFGGYELIKH